MKCTACKYRFTPTKEITYTAEVRKQESLLAPVEKTLYDCVDCPRCGRQHTLGERIARKEAKDDATD